jgi:hypothetical protein
VTSLTGHRETRYCRKDVHKCRTDFRIICEKRKNEEKKKEKKSEAVVTHN